MRLWNVLNFGNGLDFWGELYYNKQVNKIKRGVAQLVARLLWEQDVGGSNPFTPRNENPVTQVAGFSLLYDSFLSFQFSVKRDRIF